MNALVKLFIATIFLISFSTLEAQDNKKTISGQIVDADNNEPVPFASIYLKGSTIGTSSNLNGEFVFHFPLSDSLYKIIISSIGYLSISRDVRDFEINQKITLEPNENELDAIIFTASKKKKLTAKQVVRKAYKSIGENYPKEPFIIEGFVRGLQKEDDVNVEYLECASKFYHFGIDEEKRAKVELMEVRTNFLGSKHVWNERKERKNAIVDLIEDDFIRFDYGPIKGKRSWKYTLGGVLPFNNRYVYKIHGVNKPHQTAVLYIDTESFAFVRIELTRTTHKGKSWKRRLSNGQKQVYYNVVIEYQEYNGKMYPKYQMEEDVWEIYDGLNTDILLFTNKPKKELFVNKLVVDNIEEYPFSENMDEGKSIENQSAEYNEAFWLKYNAPYGTDEVRDMIRQRGNKK